MFGGNDRKLTSRCGWRPQPQYIGGPAVRHTSVTTLRMALRMNTDLFQKYRVKMNTANIQEEARVVTVKTQRQAVEEMVARKRKDVDWLNAKRTLLDLANKRARMEILNIAPSKDEQESVNKTKLDIFNVESCEDEIQIVRREPNKKDIIASLKEKKLGPKNFKLTMDSTDPQSLVSARLSDNMKDAVRVLCRLCQTSSTLFTLRHHTRKTHDLGIAEYKAVFGDPRQDVVEVVNHRCGVCAEVMLLDCDVITPHVKRHKMSHKEYTEKYMVLHYGRRQKSAALEREDGEKFVEQKNQYPVRRGDDVPALDVINEMQEILNGQL